MALQNIKRLFCEKSKVIVSEKKTGEKLTLKSKLQLSTIYYRVHSTEYIHTIFISCIWDSCQFPALLVSLCANTGITVRNVYIKSWISWQYFLRWVSKFPSLKCEVLFIRVIVIFQQNSSFTGRDSQGENCSLPNFKLVSYYEVKTSAGNRLPFTANHIF